MPTACLMGQACGHAAALAVRDNCPVRAVPATAIRERQLDGASDADDLAQRLAPPDA